MVMEDGKEKRKRKRKEEVMKRKDARLFLFSTLSKFISF